MVPGGLDGDLGDLRRSVFQVIDGRGRPVGTGFAVDDGLLVSCAHVIEMTGHSDSPPVEPVSVRFPHLDQQDRPAHVVAEWSQSTDRGDVAFLRMPGSAPAGLVPLRLAERPITEHRVKAFGFPVNAPGRGHYGYGIVGHRLTGDTGHSLVQLRDCTEITEGFSGAPVVDESTGLVVGMVDSVSAPDRLQRGIATAYLTPADRLRTLCPLLPTSEVCPYRGLGHFTGHDSDWFFGRDRAIDLVLGRLRTDGTPRLIALLGPSGSGKTSLVQAGVLPALAAGALPGSRRWAGIMARPGSDPLAELEAAGLVDVDQGLVDAVDHWLTDHPGGDRLVLVLDPFEELLGFSAPAPAHQGLLDQLVELADQQPQVITVLVMRDDFYSQLAASAPRLMGRLENQIINMPATLSRDELALMITAPAARAGVAIEQGLVDDIIADAVDSPLLPSEAPDVDGAPTTVLPLLEFVLTELWDTRTEGTLTRDRYRRIGGLTGALAGRCDRAFAQLPHDQHDIGRTLLTELVQDPSTTDPEIPLTRRRRRLAQLPQPLRDDPRLVQVAATLADGRLIVTGRDPANNNEPTFELIHDSLLRHWGQLREWLDSDRAFRSWRSGLESNYRQWAESAGQSNAAPDAKQLLRGNTLTYAAQQLRERRTDLPDHLVGYIRDSAEEDRRGRSRERRRRQLIAGLAAILVIAIVGLIIGLQQRAAAVVQGQLDASQREAADSQRQLADSQRELADSRFVASEAGLLHSDRPDLSMLLGVEAIRIAPTVEARGSLLTEQAQRYAGALPPQRYGASTMAISPDGRTLAIGGAEDKVNLWDIKNHALRSALTYSGSISSIAFSPDGKALAAAGDRGSIKLWDTHNGYAELPTLTVPNKDVNGIAFSPDNKTLAVAAGQGNLYLLTVATGVVAKTLAAHRGKDSVSEVVFNPSDSNMVATVGGHQTVELWDVGASALLASFPGNTSPVFSTALAFSPDGSTLATASSDHTVTLWSTGTHTLVATLKGHASVVNGISFLPDNRTLATASGDHTVVLWDAGTGAPLTQFPRQVDSLSGVTVTPGGLLAALSDSGSVQLWEVQGRTLGWDIGRVGFQDAAFSADGQTLATVKEGGNIDVWDVTKRRLKATFSGVTEGLRGGPRVAFDPHGQLLAVIVDRTFRLWDIQSGKLRAEATFDYVDVLSSVAFSPDGQTVAVGGVPGPVALWDVGTSKIKTKLNNPGAGGDFNVYDSLAYTDDGRYLVAASPTPELWDTKTHKRVATFELDENASDRATAGTLAISPNGLTLAGGMSDGTIRLWDMRTHKPTPRQLSNLGGHTGPINDLAFSPDGRTLATAGDDKTIKLWDLHDTYSLWATLASHTAPVNGLAFNGFGTLASASDDGTAILWDLDPDRVTKEICRKLNADLSENDWTRYIPNAPYHPGVAPCR